MDSVINEYCGYQPVAGLSSAIDKVAPSISPADFFKRYVSQRKPAIITGHLTDPEWIGSNWSNKYLDEHAGQCTVLVEKRDSRSSSSFGISAPKVRMQYGEFLAKLQDSNESLYLTTQDLERDAELDEYGMPVTVMTSPLCHLTSSFPLQPALLGHLIPYQLSLWQGAAENGSSSGLHHDFHDNLYILLRGRKRFRIFPPSAAALLRTKGTLLKIHKNGLIVYSESCQSREISIRADGVPLSFLAQRRRKQTEELLAQYEDELAALRSSSSTSSDVKNSEIERVELLIEKTEEQLDDVLGEELDWADSESTGAEENNGSVHEKSEETKDSPSKRLKTSHRAQNHFSELILPTSDSEIDKFLYGIGDVGCLLVTVAAGEMLYLPASWFHEVTSYSDSSDSQGVGHLAFNYWVFPPDNVDNFEQPYCDPFWSDRWESTVKEYAQRMFCDGQEE